jgi:fatty-acyl-CoA synthase
VPAALVRLLEEKLGAPFTIVFGQTECSPVAAQTRTTDSVEDKANTIGLPLPNMENKIIDPNTGETVPIGTIGEFCTRGYHVMLGYFEMPTRHRPRSTPTAGCIPAISARWTRAAIARWKAG